MPRQAETPFPGVFLVISYQEMFRDVPTADLLAELEASRWDALRDAEHAHSRAIHEGAIDAITRELETRQRLAARFRTDPLTPEWPSRDRRQEMHERRQAVKDQWPIEVFARSVLHCELRQAGRDELKARCPFPGHEDSDPSFYINVTKQVGLCRGCGRGGDVIDLAGHFFGIERFTDKLELLEAMSGIGRAA